MEVLAFQSEFGHAVWSSSWIACQTADRSYEDDSTGLFLAEVGQDSLCDCHGTKQVRVELGNEPVIAGKEAWVSGHLFEG